MNERFLRLLEPSFFDLEGPRAPEKPAGAIAWLIPVGATFKLLDEPGPTDEDVMIWLPEPFNSSLEFWLGDGEHAVIQDSPSDSVAIKPLDRATAARLFPHIFGAGA